MDKLLDNIICKKTDCSKYSFCRLKKKVEICEHYQIDEDDHLEREFEKQQEKNIWRFSREDRRGWA